MMTVLKALMQSQGLSAGGEAAAEVAAVHIAHVLHRITQRTSFKLFCEQQPRI